MRKFLLNAHILLLFGALISSNATAQMVTFDFAGKPGNQVSDISNYNDAKLTESIITRGNGVLASTNQDRFNSSGWTAATTVDLNDYVEFTITPAAQKKFTISTVVLQHQRSSTGPKTFVIRTSIDAYSTNASSEITVDDVTTTLTTTFTVNTTAQSQPVTFRIYGYNAEGTTGTWGPGDGTGNDIVINGSIENLSSQAEITRFALPQQTGTAAINTTDHTINIEVKNGTPVTALIPSITLSTGATVTPLSGIAQDFTLPVTYTVTAEDGTVQPWKVTVSTSTTYPGPSIAVLSPINKATEIATDAKFTLSFNRPIQKKSGSIRIFRAANDQEVAVVNAADLTIKDSQAEISLPALLEVSNSYYILIDAGTFADINGVEFPGISSDIAWQFTTILKSNNARLSDIKVNGTTITGFSPTTFDYTINYPYGTASVPDVTYTLADATALATTSDPTSMPGYSTIDVTAQDGATTAKYKVNFVWKAASSEATITSNVYTVNGTTETISNVPANTAIATFKANLIPAPNATFEVYENTRAAIANDLQTGYKVVVTAQDGTTKKTYTIAIATAVDPIERTTIKCYPNPFDVDFKISATKAIQTLTISNMIGQKVMENSYSDNEITVSASNLRTGIYFASIKFEDGTSTTIRMVKK